MATVALTVWPASVPTWKAALNEPSRMAVEPNLVWVAIRVTSLTRVFSSEFKLVRSAAELVPLADCTDSSLTRVRMFVISESAPSAVCRIATPSFAFRMAWFRPRIWAPRRVEIARPAASSDALLTRRPEDSRCSALLRLIPVDSRFLCAERADTFVLITSAIRFCSFWVSVWNPCRVSLSIASGVPFRGPARRDIPLMSRLRVFDRRIEHLRRPFTWRWS